MLKDATTWFFGFCSNCGGTVLCCGVQDAPSVASLDHKRKFADYYAECQECPKCDFIGDQDQPEWVVSTNAAQKIRDNLLKMYLSFGEPRCSGTKK